MKIHLVSQFTPQQILSIEGTKNAKYVCDTSLKSKAGGWANMPVSIFYQEVAHPVGSNYFGLYYVPNFADLNAPSQLMICDGITATEPFEGILVRGTVYYSRYRWDYHMVNPKVGVDGGRDYTRLIGNPEVVRIQIQKDQLVVNRKVVYRDRGGQAVGPTGNNASEYDSFTPKRSGPAIQSDPPARKKTGRLRRPASPIGTVRRKKSSGTGSGNTRSRGRA